MEGGTNAGIGRGGPLLAVQRKGGSKKRAATWLRFGRSSSCVLGVNEPKHDPPWGFPRAGRAPFFHPKYNPKITSGALDAV